MVVAAPAGRVGEEGVGGGVESAGVEVVWVDVGVEGMEVFQGVGPLGEMGGASTFLIHEKRRVLPCINISSLNTFAELHCYQQP